MGMAESIQWNWKWGEGCQAGSHSRVAWIHSMELKEFIFSILTRRYPSYESIQWNWKTAPAYTSYKANSWESIQWNWKPRFPSRPWSGHSQESIQWNWKRYHSSPLCSINKLWRIHSMELKGKPTKHRWLCNNCKNPFNGIESKTYNN